MPELAQTLIWIGTVAATLAAVGGLALAFGRIMKRLDTIGEGVLGKPEVVDFSGAVIEPAVPSIQARVSSLEKLVRDSSHESSSHESRVSALEAWREEHARETEMKTRMLDHILGESQSK